MREELKGCVALLAFIVAVAVGANTAKAGQKVTLRGVQVSWDGQGEIELCTDDDGNFSLRLRLNGNVSVRGKRFDAKADRLIYDSAKNVLCLESDGNDGVRLSFQTPDDGPTLRVAARKIMVRLSECRIMIEGAGWLSTPGHLPAETPPASP